MTARDELDRVLGEWLAEGPTRAPDWPVDRAIEHARSHPRRLDPLGFLREPAFPAHAGAFNPRPALLFAAALLLALAATALVVGSRPSQTPVIVPTSNPGPTATLSPSVSPSSSPPAARRHVDLVVTAGQPASVDITYEGDKLVDAQSGQPGDGVSIATDEIAVTNDGPNRLVLTWSGMPCEASYRLDVGPDGRDYILERPTCEGDATAFDRVLILTFSEPVPASQVSTKVQRAGATSQP
jgi:hypothetical protein